MELNVVAYPEILLTKHLNDVYSTHDFPEFKMLNNMETEKQKAYVIMEHYGSYDDSYQLVYGVTLDKVKAEILKTESIESHKKKSESELPMTCEKLEEFNNDEDALFASGWCFDDYTMEEFYMMEDLYDDYFHDEYVMTHIIETDLF